MKGWNRLRGLGKSPLRYGVGAALLLCAAMCAPGVARAQWGEQSHPTASRLGDLQLGGGLVLGSSTYNFQSTNLTGVSFYTTFDARWHWGGEANFKQNKSSLDSTVYERTYEFGPRVYVTRGRLKPYAKLLYGRGVYNFPNNIANIAYNMYTYGGGADFQLLRSMNVRGDYEYQNWMGFPLANLHPSVVTIGVAYHFHE